MGQVSSNYSPGPNLTPPQVSQVLHRVTYIGKTSEFSLYEAIRHTFTKYYMQLYLVGLYQECPNYSCGIKFGPAMGGTSFTLAYIGKTVEISLHLAIRPRLIKFCILIYLVGLYREWPKYSPGVKFGPAMWVTSFTWAYIGKTLEISSCT